MRSPLLMSPITKDFLDIIWRNFSSTTFKVDLIFLISNLISWMAVFIVKHGAGEAISAKIKSASQDSWLISWQFVSILFTLTTWGRKRVSKIKLFLLLMVLLTFMTIVFRYNKIKTVFNKRWEIFTKVYKNTFSPHLIIIQKTKLKLQSDELSLGEIIQDKKTIPNAIKKIEHIMKHSIPPPSDKALIIFSWSV